MSAVPDLAAYVEAFNRGDDEVYGAFYAPDVVLRNGGGTMLEGREAILDFYASVRLRLHRVMELRAVLVGNECLAAALASTFTALEDDVPLAGEVLATGDRLMLESMALYQTADGRFTSIEATTLRHAVKRKDPAQ